MCAISLTSLELQAEVLAAAGLDVDLSELDKKLGLSIVPPPPPEPRPLGRIRIKSRTYPQSWRRDKHGGPRGVCASERHDPNVWFPTRKQGPSDIAYAKGICARCPVRFECLATSLIDWEKVGIFGGETEDERRKLRRALNRAISDGKTSAAEASEWLRCRSRAEARRPPPSTSV